MKGIIGIVLLIVGTMTLVDVALGMAVRGVQSDQAVSTVIGLLAIIGGWHLWSTRNAPAPPPPESTPERPTFRVPFAAYNAADDIEAHLVCGLLRNAGIPALVIEDVSQVGVWWGGTVAELQKSQVWIEKDDAKRARPVLTEYDSGNSKRRNPPVPGSAAIVATCENCGSQVEFPAERRGTTQDCPHCRAYMDVGDSPPEPS